MVCFSNLIRLFSPIVLLLLLISGCRQDSTNSENVEKKIEHLSGGEATTHISNMNAFSQKSRNMEDPNKRIAFESGNHFFENPWVQGSQSTKGRDGLGPYFNSSACQHCHINDGRGHASMAKVDGVDLGEDFASMLIRVSRSDISDEQRSQIKASQIANVPDMNVGGQLQHRAVNNVVNEAELAVSYTLKTITFDDGHEVNLRKPKWHFESNIGDFNADSVFSARVSPPMIGLGLLQLIDKSDILENEREQALGGNSISGKVNRVLSLEFDGVMVGRFGWKAGQPSLLEQTSGAFLGDMGLTSRFHQEDNCHNRQEDCLDAPNGNLGKDGKDDPYEVIDSTLNLVEFYSHHLAVPARRNAYNEEVQKGKELFNDLGCADCHRPSYITGESDKFSELSKQTIFPYTDMLLHDMGEDLADFDVDSKPVGSDVLVEFLATATEWRTPPLWGLGLTHIVDSDATFLHDGRAQTIMEAVLWHGGEAESAKQAVLTLNAEQRELLLAFLNDL